MRQPTCSSACWISRPDLVDRPVGVQRHELAGRAVVLDDRLGLARGRSRAAARSPRACRRRGPRARRGASSALACRRRRGARRRGSRRARRPISLEHRVERLGLREVAREAVEDEAALRVVLRASRSRISAIVSSSGTSSPAVEDRLDLLAELACRPRSPRGTCRRSRCAGSPYSREIRFACVPLPGALRAEQTCSRFTTQEAFVGAHHHLRLHLAHRVERDADDDQHRGAAERARGRLREAEVVDEDRRQHGDGREEERAGQRQPGQHAVEVLRRRRARAGCPGCSRRTCAGCRPGRPG